MTDVFALFAAELEAHPVAVSKQVRGIMAKKLDAAAADAQQKALGWTDYGRGMQGSAGTIRARMSRSVGARGGTRQLGYLLADGPGIFFKEHGSGLRPPEPVLGPAVEAQQDGFAAEVLKIAGEW
jgi:hypothetical protein